MKIVFVCTGNTCRSPMAEGFMKSLFIANNIDATVISRGIAVADGSHVSPNSVVAVSEFGIDISHHVPKQLCEQDISDADYVFAVTLAHKIHIATLYPEYAEKIYAISEFLAGEDIDDPYGGNLEMYMNSAQRLRNATQNIFGKLVDTNADKL